MSNVNDPGWTSSPPDEVIASHSENIPRVGRVMIVLECSSKSMERGGCGVPISLGISASTGSPYSDVFGSVPLTAEAMVWLHASLEKVLYGE